MNCRIEGCARPRVRQKTLCHLHRVRMSRHGDPNHHEWQTADEQDVQQLCDDPRVVRGLTRLERVMVARGLTERDMPAAEIARLLGVAPRSVHRWRAEGFRQAV